jgi:lysophospholipase L1-like esterase
MVAMADDQGGGELRAPGHLGASTHWRETPPPVEARPNPAGPLVGIAVAIAIAAGLWWLGHAPAAVIVVLLAVTVTIVRLTVPAADRFLASVLVRVGHVVGLVLSVVLLGLLCVLVLIPVWLVGRLFRWDALQPDAKTRGRWAARRLRVWQVVPTRGFAYERSSRTRAARVHAAAAVLLPLAAIALLVAGPLRPWIEGLGDEDAPAPPSAEETAAPPVTAAPGTSQEWVIEGHGAQHPGDPHVAEKGPWLDDALANHAEVPVYDPYLTVRPADRVSPYLNVTDRVRHSYEPVGADGPDALDVWFFGSSAMFGTAFIRDDHTIASEFARAAEADGVTVRVSNFGVTAYETWQEALLLSQMLTERPAPDLIVFYGGYNDLSHYLQAGAPTQVSTQFADEVRQALIDQGAHMLGGVDDPAPRSDGISPENAAGVYNRSIELAEWVASANGVAFTHFLQPSLWTHGAPSDEISLQSIDATRSFYDSYGRVYDATRQLLRDDTVDLSDVFDPYDEVLFWDEVHTNERANAIVGQAIYANERETLQTLGAAATPSN